MGMAPSCTSISVVVALFVFLMNGVRVSHLRMALCRGSACVLEVKDAHQKTHRSFEESMVPLRIVMACCLCKPGLGRYLEAEA